MKRLLALTFLLLIASITSALAESGQAAIGRIKEKIISDFEKGDSSAIRGIYSADAQILIEGREWIAGPDIKTFWDQQLDKFKKPQLGTTRFIVAGPAAIVEVGMLTFEPKTKPTDGDLRYFGQYMTLWRKSGKTWKIQIDSWGSRQLTELKKPAPAAPKADVK